MNDRPRRMVIYASRRGRDHSPIFPFSTMPKSGTSAEEELKDTALTDMTPLNTIHSTKRPQNVDISLKNDGGRS